MYTYIPLSDAHCSEFRHRYSFDRIWQSLLLLSFLQVEFVPGPEGINRYASLRQGRFNTFSSDYRFKELSTTSNKKEFVRIFLHALHNVHNSPPQAHSTPLSSKRNTTRSQKTPSSSSSSSAPSFSSPGMKTPEKTVKRPKSIHSTPVSVKRRKMVSKKLKGNLATEENNVRNQCDNKRLGKYFQRKLFHWILALFVRKLRASGGKYFLGAFWIMLSCLLLVKFLITAVIEAVGILISWNDRQLSVMKCQTNQQLCLSFLKYMGFQTSIFFTFPLLQVLVISWLLNIFTLSWKNNQCWPTVFF